MSDVDKVTEAVNNIAQAFSDLHGGAELREEIARLKAINAKLGGTVAKKSAEISNLRKTKKKLGEELDLTTQRMGDMEVELNAKLDALREARTQSGHTVELQRQQEEIRGLRENLHFKSIEVKELKASLEYKDKTARQISKTNADLRSKLVDALSARDRYRQDGIELRDVLTEIRRAIDDYDNEED